MANTTLHWRFREVKHEFRNDGRLSVYLSYLLHANQRGRAWPSVETLCEETGYATAAVVEAKKWLVEVGALQVVPYDKRMGPDEARLHPRAVIMEVTGVITIDGKTTTILYHNEYSNISLSENKAGANISLSEKEVTTTTGGALDAPAAARKPTAVQVWMENIHGNLGPSDVDLLHEYEDAYGYDLLVQVIKDTATAKGMNKSFIGTKYLAPKLEDWARNGKGGSQHAEPDPLEGAGQGPKPTADDFIPVLVGDDDE